MTTTVPKDVKNVANIKYNFEIRNFPICVFYLHHLDSYQSCYAIHLLYPLYVKPRIISNYLNLWFGHDEMDARYGHSNFWCLYIYLNQNSLTAKFITCLTFLSPVVCIVVNFQSKKKSFGAICISWTWCYEDNKYKNFLKTMHIYKQNWIASSVIKYDCSSMI